ncbi:hypothetical protein QYM36_003213, partial [Artemia franciscana]
KGREPELRTRGILAFHRLAHAELPEVVEILNNVLNDYKENGQVRMGAFTLFVLSNPPIHRWFQIAFMTWFEPDSTVASFIYSSFSAMSKFETSVPLLTDLKEKSTAALFLSKPTFDPQNANRIWSQYLRHEKLGAYIRSELFSGGKKPTNLYARFNWNIGPFDFDAIEVHEPEQVDIFGWSTATGLKHLHGDSTDAKSLEVSKYFTEFQISTTKNGSISSVTKLLWITGLGMARGATDRERGVPLSPDENRSVNFERMDTLS